MHTHGLVHARTVLEFAARSLEGKRLANFQLVQALRHLPVWVYLHPQRARPLFNYERRIHVLAMSISIRPESMHMRASRFSQGLPCRACLDDKVYAAGMIVIGDRRVRAEDFLPIQAHGTDRYVLPDRQAQQGLSRGKSKTEPLSVVT